MCSNRSWFETLSHLGPERHLDQEPASYRNALRPGDPYNPREEDLEEALRQSQRLRSGIGGVGSGIGWVQSAASAGDVAFHSAGALHGVTRVRRGERYSLVVFFESTRAAVTKARLRPSSGQHAAWSCFTPQYQRRRMATPRYSTAAVTTGQAAKP